MRLKTFFTKADLFRSHYTINLDVLQGVKNKNVCKQEVDKANPTLTVGCVALNYIDQSHPNIFGSIVLFPAFINERMYFSILFEASNSIVHLQALLLRQSFAAIIAEIKILCHRCSAVRAKLIIDIARFLRFRLRIAEALV